MSTKKDAKKPRKGKSKEEQQRRVLEYKFFNLTSCKVLKDGVQVSHHETGIDGGDTTKTGNAQPHPDLQDKLDELKPYMAIRLGLTEGWDFAREQLRSEPDALAEAKNGYDLAVDRCSVNGIKLSGEGENYGVQITGSIKLPGGGSVGLACGKIKFASEKFDFAEDVETICEEVKKEIYAYRFQQKKLQTDINTEIEKEKNPELFKEPESEPKKRKSRLGLKLKCRA